MNYKPTKKTDELYAALMLYLRGEGFICARTRAGFIAVDKSGVVFCCTPFRTYGTVQHAAHGRIERVHCAGVPLASWFTRHIDGLRAWRTNPAAKVSDDYPLKRKQRAAEIDEANANNAAFRRGEL